MAWGRGVWVPAYKWRRRRCSAGAPPTGLLNRGEAPSERHERRRSVPGLGQASGWGCRICRYPWLLRAMAVQGQYAWHDGGMVEQMYDHARVRAVIGPRHRTRAARRELLQTAASTPSPAGDPPPEPAGRWPGRTPAAGSVAGPVPPGDPAPPPRSAPGDRSGGRTTGGRPRALRAEGGAAGARPLGAQASRAAVGPLRTDSETQATGVIARPPPGPWGSSPDRLGASGRGRAADQRSQSTRGRVSGQVASGCHGTTRRV